MIDMHVSLFKYLLLKCFNTWTKNDYVIQYCWYRQRHISYTLFFWWFKLPFFILSVFLSLLSHVSEKLYVKHKSHLHGLSSFKPVYNICLCLNKIFVSGNFVLIKTIFKKRCNDTFFPHTKSFISTPPPLWSLRL